jgi:hypothetical protein
MNQTEMVEAVEKMRTYVAFAEQEIAKRKIQCELMQDELYTSRRLMTSLQHKLRETEAKVVRQQQLKRVSEFKMQKIESVREEVCMVIGGASVGESRNSTVCQRKGGCCGIERLYFISEWRLRRSSDEVYVIPYDCLQTFSCRKRLDRMASTAPPCQSVSPVLLQIVRKQSVLSCSMPSPNNV